MNTEGFLSVYTFYIFLIQICGFLLNGVQAESVLTAPKITDWGQWGSWEFCPQGTFVTGMQLYTDPPHGTFKDDRGLTGIHLFCNKFGKNTENITIKSSMGSVGKWGKKYFCHGLMTGFQFRSEKYRSAFVDDTAGNNVRMFCDHSENLYTEGDGTAFGSWTEQRLCNRHEAICGIRTQVEPENGFKNWDQTGLNNVMMKCCDIPHPVQNCVPKTTWELIASCNGSSSVADKKQCDYTRKVGVSYIESYSELVPLHESVGYGLRKMLTQFQSKFLNVSSDASFEVMREESKDYYWLLSPNYIWEPQRMQKVKVIAKNGSEISLYQIHGKCGMLEIWGTRLKKVETYSDSMKKHTTFGDFTEENELDYYIQLMV